MSTLTLATNIARGLFHVVPSILAPKQSIKSLLKVGNTVSKSRAFQSSLERVKADPCAKALIEMRYSPGIPSVAELLAYKPGTLGAELGAFLHENDFTPYPTPAMHQLSEEAYFRERWREIHDILHVVWGYKTDLEGEASINIHMAAQSHMPMCILIPMGVILKTMAGNPRAMVSLMDAIANAWRRGTTGRNPIGVRWEEHLDRPLEEIRGWALQSSPVE